MIIGLTGQIGAGKTEAAKVFRRLGAAVIDADRIGRQVVEASPALRRRLAREFGAEIFDRNGRLRRSRLAALAFADRRAGERLNALVHPPLLRELWRQVRAAARKHSWVVIDAALLLHWGMDREVDYVLVIHASRRLRLARLAARGIARADALARERAQLPFSEFRRRADRLILNGGDRHELAAKVTKLFHCLMGQTD